MYGAYAPRFRRSRIPDMVATGLPSPEELETLEPFRGRLPDRCSASRSCPQYRMDRARTGRLLRKAQRAAGCETPDQGLAGG